MTSTSKSLVTLAAGLALLIPASIGLLDSNGPSVLSPLPCLTIIPTFLFGLARIAIAIPMLLFFAWNPQLFLGEAAVPKRSYVLLIVLSMLCVAYLASGWKWGLEYQGLRYTAIVSATNIFWIILLMLGFWRSWKSKELSFGASFYCSG
jgi:hypothetical protein